MVLDVSTSYIDGIVRLVTPEQEERGEYVALSYCWGGPQKLVTTVANRTDLQRGFELSRLPRTIMEAVQVTASLGIRYLWVDALCIVQDDEASKAVEIEKMGNIYGDATIVLLAASGTSRSADDGFLNPYRDISIVPYYSILTGTVVSVCLAVGTETAPPLDMRGWTYQERNLASRRLIFGGPRGVSFSCAEQSLVYESGAWKRDGNGADTTERVIRNEDSRTRWHEIFEEYSLRALTFAADRLPAIAGFAANHAPEPGDVYIAGMWRSQIVDDLMWKVQFGQLKGEPFKLTLDQYRSPGWSWISVLDHVPNRVVGCAKNDLRRRLYLGGQEENVAYYVDHSLQLGQPNAHFGRVLSGSITLRAKMVPVKSAGAGLDMTLVGKNCNYHLTGDEAGRLELLLTKFCSRWSMEAPGEVEEGYASLIVLPGDKGTFRRLGSFWDWTDAAATAVKQMIDWAEVPYRQVTLM
ncbi:HET-domain-containing protein [Coniochaeta sp. PMI_546]|nr:HET-domain-containing protein [Coniochaeta sp. PMI_546]